MIRNFVFSLVNLTFWILLCQASGRTSNNNGQGFGYLNNNGMGFSGNNNGGFGTPNNNGRLGALNNAPSTCTINLDQMRDDEPIFLSTYYSYMIPNGNSIILNKGDQFFIDCGQSRTFAEYPNVQQLTVQCWDGQFHMGNGRPNRVEVGNLKCVSPTRTTDLVRVEKTRRTCGNDGRIYKIGINVQQANGQRLLELLESCFDEQTKSVFYVKSHILGAMSPRGGKRYSINNGKWANGQPVPSSYFETKSVGRLYSKKKLDKGHLAPNADYQFAQFRRVTSNYFNMVPMESTLNQNDWGDLEGYIRKEIQREHAPATIFTGGFALNDRALESKFRQVNLLNQDERGNTLMGGANDVASIFVPDLIWKVVKVGDKAVVFYMFDNSAVTQPQSYCTNLCPNQAFFCCNVNEFVENTENIRGNFDWPAEARSQQTLTEILKTLNGQRRSQTKLIN